MLKYYLMATNLGDILPIPGIINHCKNKISNPFIFIYKNNSNWKPANLIKIISFFIDKNIITDELKNIISNLNTDDCVDINPVFLSMRKKLI
jgi:hypothetical protein